MLSKQTIKEFIIDITLKTLTIKSPVPQPSKALCQIHYGQNYLKLKLQPTVKNSVASFYQERIRIPYARQIALVFKLQKMKKQIFLGHYMVDCQQFMQNRIWSIKSTEKLEETNAFIDFQLKIVDKKLYEDDEDSEEDFLSEDIHLKAKDTYSETQPLGRNTMHSSSRSLFNGDSPFVIIKKQDIHDISPSPQQFAKLIAQAEEILRKHELYNKKQTKMSYYQKDQNGKLTTPKIQAIQKKILQKQKQQSNNSMIFLCIIGVIAFLIGIIVN